MDYFKDVLSYRLEDRKHDKDGWVISEEYIIPDDEKETVLKQHYPFEDMPGLEEELYDLHADKNFFVRDYKLVREHGCNLLVSPYYYESGGSVIDWMPLDAWVDDEEGDEDESDFTADDADGDDNEIPF